VIREPKPAPDGFRLRDGAIEERVDGAWCPVSRSELQRRYKPASRVWRWLKSQGVKRPSPSGPVKPRGERADGRRRVEVFVDGELEGRIQAYAEREGMPFATAFKMLARHALRAEGFPPADEGPKRPPSPEVQRAIADAIKRFQSGT
jgi:hypothetical protein